jgi:hypothetical protein
MFFPAIIKSALFLWMLKMIASEFLNSMSILAVQIQAKSTVLMLIT